MVSESNLAFVLRAKNRKKILRALYNKKLISSQIEKETGMYKSHVSRSLKELLSKEFIVCINPGERNFKFYKITNKGKKVLDVLEQIVA